MSTSHHTPSKKAAPLHPILLPNPLEFISVDLIGPLPLSNGYNAIMVVVDYPTKAKILIGHTIELTAYGTAILFRNHVFKRFGLPLKVTFRSRNSIRLRVHARTV